MKAYISTLVTVEPIHRAHNVVSLPTRVTEQSAVVHNRCASVQTVCNMSRRSLFLPYCRSCSFTVYNHSDSSWLVVDDKYDCECNERLGTFFLLRLASVRRHNALCVCPFQAHQFQLPRAMRAEVLHIMLLLLLMLPFMVFPGHR